MRRRKKRSKDENVPHPFFCGSGYKGIAGRRSLSVLSLLFRLWRELSDDPYGFPLLLLSRVDVSFLSVVSSPGPGFVSYFPLLDCRATWGTDMRSFVVQEDSMQFGDVIYWSSHYTYMSLDRWKSRSPANGAWREGGFKTLDEKASSVPPISILLCRLDPGLNEKRRCQRRRLFLVLLGLAGGGYFRETHYRVRRPGKNFPSM